MEMDVLLYKKAISRFPTGVAVISSSFDGRKAGMTANAILSLSIQPPTVVMSMLCTSDTTRTVENSGAAVISFLSHDQQSISELFASHVSPKIKFERTAHHTGRNGQPVIDGASSVLEVEVKDVVKAGDHDLIIARVTHASVDSGKMPLLYWGSRYGTLKGERLIELPTPAN